MCVREKRVRWFARTARPKWLAFEKPADEAGTLFEWYKRFADKPQEVKRRLCDDKWLDGLCQLVLKHLGELKA